MRVGRLTAIAMLIGALCALPVASVFFNVFATVTPGVWPHLAQTVLPEYAANTLWLLAGVGFGVVVVGVSTAWLTAMHEFPGRRAFEWALILPLAMPAYVIAFVYTDLLQFVGPVQTWLRELTGWAKADYWFPDGRSPGEHSWSARRARSKRDARWVWATLRCFSAWRCLSRARPWWPAQRSR